jgi:hypothetical protein
MKSKDNIFIHEYLAEMVSRTDYMHRFSKHNDIRDFASCDLDLPVTLSLIKILFSSKYDSCDLHMLQSVSLKLKIVSVPVVQSTPVHPLVQMQLYEPTVLLQVPPFRHVLLEVHSSKSVIRYKMLHM